jgi:hypothetical protein
MQFLLKLLKRIILSIFLIIGVAGALDALPIEKFLLPLGVIMTILVFYELDLPKKITKQKSRLLNMIISFWSGFMPVASGTELTALRMVYLSSMPTLLIVLALKRRDRFGRHFVSKVPELLSASFFLAFLMEIFGGWEYAMFILLVLWTSSFLLELFSRKLELVLTRIEESDNVFWRLVFHQLYGFGPFYLMLLVPVTFVTLSVLVVLGEFLVITAGMLLQHDFSAFFGMFSERVFQLVSMPYLVYQFYLLLKLMQANSSREKGDVTIVPLSIVTASFSILAVWHVFARHVRSDSALGFINTLTRWQLWRSDVRNGLTVVMFANLLILFGLWLLKGSSLLTLRKRAILSLELGICGITVYLYLLGNYIVVVLALFALGWFMFQVTRPISENERRIFALGIFVSSIAMYTLGIYTHFFALFEIPVEFLWLIICISGVWLALTLGSNFLGLTSSLAIIVAFVIFVFGNIYWAAIFLTSGFLLLVLDACLFKRKIILARKTLLASFRAFAKEILTRFWGTCKKIFGVLATFFTIMAILILKEFLSAPYFNVLILSNPFGFGVMCLIVFLLAVVTYTFMLSQVLTIWKSESVDKAARNLSIVVAAMSFTYFFFNPSFLVLVIWLATTIIPIFAAAKFKGIGNLGKMSNAAKSMALVAFCSLLVSGSVSYVFPVSPIYDPDFFTFIDRTNEGNYASLMAFNGSNNAMLEASHIYWIAHSNQSWPRSKHECFLALNKSAISVFNWTNKARSAFNECRAYLQRSWILQRDLVLGLEFRMLYLNLLENTTVFYRIYGDLFYYQNRSLLQSLSFHKNTTEVVLSQMQECVDNSSSFNRVFFMRGFDAARQEELNLLNDMYMEASEAFS